MRTSLKNILSVFCLMSLCVAAFGDLSDAEWAELKRQAVARPRRMIVNDDGCDGSAYPIGREVSEKAFCAFMLDRLLGGPCDVLCYCPGMVGLTVTYDSEVADTFTTVPFNNESYNAVADFEKVTGKNPMMLAKEFAQRHNMEFFGSIRVNDTHDRFFPQAFSRFKKEHPGLLCGSQKAPPPRGSWTSFNFAMPEVRQYFIDIADEMMRKFDVDGLEFDFYRDDGMLKSWTWRQPVTMQERDDITEMFRKLRKITEEYGRRRGRPVLIAMRTPDSPGICWSEGMDIERWMQEGLLDMLFSGGDHGHYDCYGVMRNLCGKYGVRYFAGLDCSSIKATGIFNRNTIAACDGQAAGAYAAGAEGLYLFNMFYNPAYFVQGVSSLDELRYRPRLYFATLQQRWAVMSLTPEESRFDRLPMLSPIHPRRLGAQRQSFEAVIQTGEDPERLPVRSATLHVAMNGDSSRLRVFYNGTELQRADEGKASDGVAHFAVPAGLLASGPNRVRFQCQDDGSAWERTILVGDQLLKMPGQLPWRRLTPGNALPGSERIVDGAYRISDLTDEHCANLLYPMPGLDGANLTLSFSVRVLPGAEPRSAVLRMANGRNVAVLDFRPDGLWLDCAEKPLTVDTLSFHEYQAELADGVLTIAADGKTLWRGKCGARADDYANAVPDCSDSVNGRDTDSILIGSMTQEGKGASEWRNIRIQESMTLTDVALEVKTLPPPLPELRAALASDHPWQVELLFPHALYPAGMKVEYPDTPHPAGGAFFDNDDGNVWRLVRQDEPEFLKENAGRFLVLSFRAAVERTGKKASDHNFMAAVRAAALDGKGNRQLIVKFNDHEVQTPWQTLPGDGAMHEYTLAMDRRTGETLMLLDGEWLDQGFAQITMEKPVLYFGDGSSVISGAFRMEWFKAACFGD